MSTSGASRPVASQPAAETHHPFRRGTMVCLAKCWPCMTQQCPGGEHRWADGEDIEHAESIGRPETAEGVCGCPCAKGPVLDNPEPPDVDLVSIDGSPCELCGEQGACGYDLDGRPYIHVYRDDDEHGIECVCDDCQEDQ